MKPKCPVSGRVIDFAAGELAPQDRREMETHLLQCAGCREEHASYHRLIAHLRSLPVLETSKDFAPLVLAAVRTPHRATAARNTIWLWSAAAVALLSFLPLIHRHSSAPAPLALAADEAENPATSLDRAIQWLCTHQEPDGSWDAETWGGNRNFEVALTALPAIAVIGRKPTTPERSAAAARAIEWLRTQQSQDGIFGPENQGMPYNHSIATLALLHAYRQELDPYLKRSVDSAISAMVRAQSRDGGWSWRGTPTSDSTITAWHIEALRMASELGFENSRTALDRGLAWQASHSEVPATPISTRSLLVRDASNPGKTSLDLHRSFFLTANLQREQTEDSLRQLAAIRQSLINYQISHGAYSGSWPPDDRWSNSGGRIFSTALASLSLETE